MTNPLTAATGNAKPMQVFVHVAITNCRKHGRKRICPQASSSHSFCKPDTPTARRVMADLDEVKGELGDKKEVEKKEVVISECPVQAVIVYADRAEVGIRWWGCSST